VRFLAEAQRDLIRASARYEVQEPGLGVRFRNEARRVLQRISRDPLLWREREGGYRRVNRPVFPYFIAYVIRDDAVLVAAIIDQRREPDFWLARLEE
jgi:plasmid stabilization system protein ParE